jgi:hypothetical protein
VNEIEYLFQSMHPRHPDGNPISWKEQEIPIMKSAVGVLAGLLLVSTLAVGQSYQPLPFPQEANTALQGGSYEESAPSATADMPPSMAADQGDEQFSPTFTYEEHGDRALGSPFPSAANPALGHHDDEMAPPAGFGTAHDEFPSAADPSRNW